MPVTCPKCRSENPAGKEYCADCGSKLSPSSVAPSPESRPSPPAISPAATQTIQAVVRELDMGSTFAGRYQIIEELGKGGMGRVYKVFDTKIKEKVALKLIKPEIASDKDTLERFSNEIRLARRIGHRNVCRMFDLGEADGIHFITMEYVSGEDLKSMIEMSGSLSLGMLLSVGKQVCDGLAEAHSLGVIHRDLKPKNIMIDKHGNAKIMDFGIARSIKDRGMTDAGTMIGTPEYMSPEQAEAKEVDHRSDIYSLGVILYEMATSHVPFTGETALSIAMKHKGEIPKNPKQLNPQIPDDLSRVILRCLAKDKEKRYQSAAEVHSELEKIEKGIPTTERVVPRRKTTTAHEVTVRLPSRKVWITAAGVLLALVAFAVWQFIPEKDGARRTLAVMGFKNQTGDAGLDYLREAIPHLLITSLEQSKRLRVTSWERMKDLLRNSGRDAAAIYDEEAGFEACRREGIEAVVLGSFVKAGETFATDVQVLDATSKHILKSASAKGSGLESILKSQIDDISRTIRRGFALPALKIEAPGRKIIDLTTGSMEAYNYYLKAREAFDNFFFAQARTYAEKAVAVDPKFALGYYILSRAASNLLDYPARDEALEKAKTFSAKATEKERLFIEARYASIIEHDSAKRLRVMRELVTAYPDDKEGHYELAMATPSRPEAIAEYEKAMAIDPMYAPAFNMLGYAYARMGDFDKAIGAFSRYAELNPGLPNPIDSIAEMNMLRGNLDEAVRRYLEALSIKPDFYASCHGLVYVYALKEDYAEAGRWLEEFIKRTPTPQARTEAFFIRDFLDYFLGRLDRSLRDLSSLRSLAAQFKFDLGVAAADFVMGYLYADRGEYDKARKSFEDWFVYVKKDNPTRPDYAAALRGATLGKVDLEEGRREAVRDGLAEMEKLLPRLNPDERLIIEFHWRLLGAELALAEGSIEKAISIGEKIESWVLENVNTPTIIPYNLPFMKDVLARAYWKKGDFDKAAAEYERLTTIDPKSPLRMLIPPLYHYRLGRVLEEKGEKDKARLQYEKFLKGWADADPRFIELKDARARLAAVKRAP